VRRIRSAVAGAAWRRRFVCRLQWAGQGAGTTQETAGDSLSEVAYAAARAIAHGRFVRAVHFGSVARPVGCCVTASRAKPNALVPGVWSVGALGAFAAERAAFDASGRLGMLRGW
jgi:hypothetical protein